MAVVSALLILVVVSAFLFGCSGQNKPENREIAALVNGEKIYFDDVNEYYTAYLTPEQQASLTKADALSLVIERELLYQEAGKQGFSATAADINREYKSYLSATNLTESRLGRDLASKNSSIASFKSSIGKRIAIGQLLDSKIPSKFIIKQEEAEAVYNASGFRSQNITFEDAEKSIIDYLTAQKQKAAQDSYILDLKEKAKVLIVGVPD